MASSIWTLLRKDINLRKRSRERKQMRHKISAIVNLEVIQPIGDRFTHLLTLSIFWHFSKQKMGKTMKKQRTLIWWLDMRERGRVSLQCRGHKRCGCDPWFRKIPWRREWRPTPVSLPEESHGQKSLAGYSPRGRRESTEHMNQWTMWLAML